MSGVAGIRGQGEDHPRPGLSSSREGRFVLLGGAARRRAACFFRVALPPAPSRGKEADWRRAAARSKK